MKPIIVERIEANLNISELLSSVLPLMEKYPAVHRSPAFGGWSLQSTNGSYMEGWGREYVPYNGPGNECPSWNPRNDVERNMRTVQESIVETEMMTQPFRELIGKLDQMGLNPRRARIIRIKPGDKTVWHIDGSDRFYQVRVNVPLYTNENCLFETEQGSYHMRADGALYFVKINQLHRAVNFGQTVRYQFVCHVWDRHGITQYHRYIPQESLGESDHLDEIDMSLQFRKY